MQWAIVTSALPNTSCTAEEHEDVLPRKVQQQRGIDVEERERVCTLSKVGDLKTEASPQLSFLVLAP